MTVSAKAPGPSGPGADNNTSRARPLGHPTMVPPGARSLADRLRDVDAADCPMVASEWAADLVQGLNDVERDEVADLVEMLGQQTAELIEMPSDRRELVAVARSLRSSRGGLLVPLDNGNQVALPLRAWCAQWFARPLLSAAAGRSIPPVSDSEWLTYIDALFAHAPEEVA